MDVGADSDGEMQLLVAPALLKNSVTMGSVSSTGCSLSPPSSVTESLRLSHSNESVVEEINMNTNPSLVKKIKWGIQDDEELGICSLPKEECSNAGLDSSDRGLSGWDEQVGVGEGGLRRLQRCATEGTKAFLVRRTICIMGMVIVGVTVSFSFALISTDSDVGSSGPSVVGLMGIGEGSNLTLSGSIEIEDPTKKKTYHLQPSKRFDNFKDISELFHNTNSNIFDLRYNG